MDRPQKSIILKDLEKKIVLLTGPRQVGKTTLAKSFTEHWPDLQYLNFDAEKDRLLMLRQEWNRKSPLIILDEFHKLKKWKSRIKGIYDTEGIPPRLLITGSARLDIYRRGGESLAGRHFLHRLYPLSLAELKETEALDKILEQLMTLGGFPEPFLSQSEQAAKRWRTTHLERIVRIDIQDLEPVRDVQSLLLLIALLRERVGSPISYQSLAEDIQVSPHTIKRWIQILENMYIIFTVTTHHRNLARAILKEPKIYFYDTGQVKEDRGARFENAVALSLRKWLHYLEDTQGEKTALHYLRDKEKREIDFVVLRDGKIDLLLECKLSDDSLHRPLLYYHQRLKPKQSIQLVHQLNQPKTVEGISIQSAGKWLSSLPI